MRIAFLDTIDYDYTIDTAYQKPLGGSSSALCYLAEALVKQQQEVFLLNKTTTPGWSRGVMCLPFYELSPEIRQSFDVLVVVNMAGEGQSMKQVLNPATKLILWSGHAHNQPFMQGLLDREEQQVYDGIALVSDWQRDQYHHHFGIDLSQMRVLRNAISPAFRDRFPPSSPILAQKTQPPVLAYTSTPFRGLDILLEVFPRICKAVPGTVLQVFSSMKVYNMADTDYEPLYQQCRQMEGVEYIGSVSQPALADYLQTATALAYPNTFAETSCIAVMEAMASGCQVVTSELGALPETCAGFGRLIPVTGNWETFKDDFVNQLVDVLQSCVGSAIDRTEQHLRQQIHFVNATYNWTVRAGEWIEWLQELINQRSGATVVLPESASQPWSLQQAAYQAYLDGQYSQAALLYQQMVQTEAAHQTGYWYLGLMLLLQGLLEAAQEVWLTAMMEGDIDQLDQRLAELVMFLQTECDCQQATGNQQAAAVIQSAIQQLKDGN
ncbi:glycosyltransferase family 4 protein [Leptothermofonsia sichuanensis E412]|uniref:glycosyltransferase family 4 protein n=1 Tax=Leptothermofonsia sichuanensis TaxID=2917832 RepID=UPI001CA706F7|nr:glycosyltransferase family 4 protein [Leptothermofonsia sichuanensis]QZZ20866.1 glycosyltransferase family 4 protein [Leptothermofonsia sichuanensis E412]